MFNLPNWVSDIAWAIFALYLLNLLHKLIDWVEDQHPLATHFANQEAIRRSLQRLIQDQQRQIALIQGQPDPEGKALKDLDNDFHQDPPEYTAADLLRKYGTTDNYMDEMARRARNREWDAADSRARAVHPASPGTLK